MRILFDIYHLAEFNWIKNTILRCNFKYDITCVNRGPLAKVIKEEIPNSNPIVIGDYKFNKGFFSLFLFVIIPRMAKLYKLIKKNNYDLIVSTSYQAPIISKLLGKKSILINDDPTRIHFRYINKFTSVFLSPPIIKQRKGVEIFNALIHWSYLSPSVFKPNTKVLKEYNLERKQYIFIREVSADTTNYATQDEGLIQSVANKIDRNIKVVFSLEDKSKRYKYPAKWILLQEPVSDIFSLMYFSKVVLSSGDSVAREGATLGVPSLYCGVREMPANEMLIKLKMLFKVPSSAIAEYIENFYYDKITLQDQDSFRNMLKNEWVDVNELLLSKINEILL